MFSFYKRKHYLKKVTISGFENAKTSSSLHLFSFKTHIINKIENSLKLFSIIIQNRKSYIENVKISKSR